MYFHVDIITLIKVDNKNKLELIQLHLRVTIHSSYLNTSLGYKIPSYLVASWNQLHVC